MYNGIINVYKEKGFTSHDVIAKLRGILKQKKIGHTGTLDPDAAGVLPVCLGSGTRLCDTLTDKSKEYRAVMLLGVITDTEDITGKIIEEHEPVTDEKKIKDIILSFVGEYSQIPPMYSALKVNGRKLYELAREGLVIERKPRDVFIESIEIEKIDFPRVTFKVKCSKGTYIRSLCRDIGEKAGCGACMESLIRTRVSNFEIEQAHTLDEIERMVNSGEIKDIIVPVDSCFKEYDSIVVSGRNEMLVRNGNPFKEEKKGTGLVRVYFWGECNNQFAGIYRYDNNNDIYKPEKMFLSQEKK